jgi:adenine phosphoribosyltransferase
MVDDLHSLRAVWLALAIGLHVRCFRTVGIGCRSIRLPLAARFAKVRPKSSPKIQSAAFQENPMISATLDFDLRSSIRTIPDYPKPGIMFRDITTLLGNARAFRRAVDELVQPWAGSKIDKVAGMEARGFILGGAVAHQVSAGFIPIRKKGKLPHKRVSIAYSLEYGLDEMEMHEDAVSAGEKVILVDDLIATGGTAEGAVKLLKQQGADVLAACFIIDLPELGGADKIRKLDVPVRTLIAFEGH